VAINAKFAFGLETGKSHKVQNFADYSAAYINYTDKCTPDTYYTYYIVIYAIYTRVHYRAFEVEISPHALLIYLF